MFWNYLKVAYRNLLRHPLYAAINVVGLGIAIAFCVLAFLYVRHEWTYDAFHENADRIYRVYTESDRRGRSPNAPAALAPALAEVLPDVRFVRMDLDYRFIQQRGATIKERVHFADPEIFEVFSFPLLKGDPKTALDDPYSVIVTEELAEKYFPDEDPMGKTLSIQTGDAGNTGIRVLTVTGIVESIPKNSSIRFGLLSRLDFKDSEPRWQRRFLKTYALLPDYVSPSEVERQLENLAAELPSSRLWTILKLQPLTDIHFDSRGVGLRPAGNPVYSYILACIAMLVLVIAAVNYTNLSIGRSFSRAREVGLRKVAGGLRTQLAIQFLAESVSLTLFALGLGLALAELLMPGFNSLTQKEFSLSDLTDSTAPGFLIVLLLVIGIVSGGYPAFFVSGLLPVEALEGRMKSDRMGYVRRVLVVFQIAISIILVASTTIVARQLNMIATKPLGFNPKHVLVVFNTSKLGKAGYKTYTDMTRSYHAVLNTTGTGHVFSNMVQSLGDVQSDGTRLKDVQVFDGEIGLLQTLGMRLKSGRAFERDGDARTSVLVNEALVEKFGWQAPLGKTLRIGGPSGPKLAVIGVVHNFHFQSLHHPVRPAVMLLNRFSRFSPPRMLMVRIHPDDSAGTLRFLEEKWKEIAPDEAFYYSYIDDLIDDQYQEENRWLRILGYASLFAVFIACLGAFGLTSLTVARRTKEIGIRKIAGASTTSIVALLGREFVILVGIASLVAWPVTYLAGERWLRDFAYRVDPGLGTFLLGSLLMLLMVLLAVSLQVTRAARGNPVDALRYE